MMWGIANGLKQSGSTMADEKQPGAEEVEQQTAAPDMEGEKPLDANAALALENERKDVFDLGLDTRNSFKMLRKTVRHYIAHEEYGVLFSFCGVRITRKLVEYNPPPRQSDVRCEKCKEHIWQIVATQQYAERLKNKKDLDD